MRRNSDGSALVLALVTLGILSALGSVMVDRSIHLTRKASWSQGHVAARLLADSAVEELFLDLSRKANTPGEAAYDALRQAAPSDGGSPSMLQDLGPRALKADATELAASMGGTVSVECAAALARLETSSMDSRERTGKIILEARVRLSGRSLEAVDRVRVERDFRVARVTPPEPLDQVALFVEKMPAENKRLRGQAAFAALTQGSRSLLEVLSGRGALGFQKVGGGARATVARAMATLTPEALGGRAQLVARSSAGLAALLQPVLSGQGALSGVIRLASNEPVRIAFDRFRGNAMIVLDGPVEVGDIRLDDPARDSLTIVSSKGIAVTGRTVEASLVSPSTGKDALVFAQQASVSGTTVAGSFPRSAGLAAADFGGCRFDRPAPVANPYVVAIGPYPLSVTHARD